jgi:hypothetical protein
MAKGTIKDTMALMDEFLGSFRKEAYDATAKQQSLGLEQTTAAKAGGATAAEGDARDSQDSKALDTENELAAVRMGSEDSAEDKSEVIGKVKKEVVTENLSEKTARATRLGNAILNAIEKTMNKEAAEEQNARKPLSPEDELLQKCAQSAAIAAQDYYESHLLGQLQRIKDEAELHGAGIPKEALAKVGGISGLLDKVAAEDPALILPPGMVGPEELPAEGDMEGGDAELDALAEQLAAQGVTPEELEAAFGDVAPEEAAGDVVAEGAPMEEGGVEGDVSEEDLAALADQLDAAGVTPEDLASAFEDVKALQEAGVAPDELAAAVEEMLGQEAASGEEAAPAEGAEEAVDAAAAEELPKEASALDRNRIETIKKYLLGK